MLYSRDLEPDSKKIKTTEFVDKSATLTIRNIARDLGFYVNAILLISKEEQGIIASGRKLTIKIDGKSYFVEAEKTRVSKKIGELVCRSLEPGGALKQDEATVAGPDSYLGALIRISRRPALASAYGIEDNVLKILGGNGWVSLSRSTEQATDLDKSGSVHLVSLRKHCKSRYRWSVGDRSSNRWVQCLR